MTLNLVWFVLVGILYTGYFVLEGFDFGVGILLPFLGKNDARRRQMLAAIGPHWGANEVWLITAGGATFAAFPQWYATLFSGFYLPLFLILLALIFRGVAIEFRNLDEHPLWHSTWDWAIFGGSLLPALLWGVAFANLFRGIPIDAHMNYAGGFWNLLNGYALLGGVVSLAGFILQGALYLSISTHGEGAKAAETFSKKFWILVFVLLFALDVWSGEMIQAAQKPFGVAFISLIAAIFVLLGVGYNIGRHRFGWAFILSSLTIGLVCLTYFSGVFPNVLISSLNPAWNLTIYNASSSAYTLKVMVIVAAIFVPIVLAYEAWSYWLFSKKTARGSEDTGY